MRAAAGYGGFVRSLSSGALAADAAMPATELFSGLVDVDADVRLKMAICSEAP